MFVLDEQMGKNGLPWGIDANCRRFSFDFQAVNESEARCICEAMGLAYDGEILLTEEW